VFITGVAVIITRLSNPIINRHYILLEGQQPFEGLMTIPASSIFDKIKKRATA
jgi:hypothetical protein